MSAYFASLGALDLVFVSLAALGALLLLVRTLLVLAGIGHHDVDLSGADSHFDVQFEHGDDIHAGGDAHGDNTDSDAGFRLLSLQSLTAFFLIAGLAGLALHRGSRLGEAVSLVGSLVAGLAIMFLIAWLLGALRRLQSSGTIDLRSAIGVEGTIYLTIPRGGSGQAQLCVQNRWRVLDAVAEPPAEIRTGDRVEVVDVIDGRTLVVRKIAAPAADGPFWNPPLKS